LIIPNDIIVDAKHKFGDEAANIIAVELGIENYDSKNLKGRCPFHNESTPSFVWNSKDDAFKCFGCGKRYGILDHYTQFHKISFLQAVEKLFELRNPPSALYLCALYLYTSRHFLQRFFLFFESLSPLQSDRER